MARMTQPQSQRNSSRSRGVDAGSGRGSSAKNKDTLKPNRSKSMAGNPAAQKDQFGSRHNADNIKAEQRRAGRPAGKQDLAFRESAQDVRRAKGEKNRLPGGRKRK